MPCTPSAASSLCSTPTPTSSRYSTPCQFGGSEDMDDHGVPDSHIHVIVDEEVIGAEGAHLDGAHIDGTDTTATNHVVENARISSGHTLTDEQLQRLIHDVLANNASAIADRAAAQPHGTPVAMPPFRFVEATQPSTASTKSLFDLFSFVPRETLDEIVHFEFFPQDLYKLDPTSSEVSKDYPTLPSLLEPLFLYFQILGCYAATSDSLPAVVAIHHASLAYSAHLSSLNRTYDWPAVVQYHSQFFFRRSREMARGDFSGWCSPDVELMSQFLFGHNLPKPLSAKSYFLSTTFLIMQVCLISCALFL